MTAWNSPFAIIAEYKKAKEKHAAPSAKPRKYVRGTFGTPDGTMPHLAPKLWNGADFSRHGGAYSKARVSK